MTGELTADWAPVLRRRRRQLVLRSLLPFGYGAALLAARALSGLSVLTFGGVIFLAYSAVCVPSIRPLWAPRARARWEAIVMDDAIVEHALITRERVGPELHERVSVRARQLDSDAVLSSTFGLLGVVIVVFGGLSVVLSIRRARSARRWLADPPPPPVPDDASHRA